MEMVTLKLDAIEQADAVRDALNQGLAAVREKEPLLAKAYDPLVRAAIGDALRRQIDFDVFDWLAGAWTVLDRISELKHAAGTVVQPLEELPVTGSLHPIVTLRIGPKSFELPFTIAVTADFAAILLTATGGYLTGVKAARCELKVAAAYKTSQLLGPQTFWSYNAPFEHSFKAPGLLIPGTR